VLSHAHPELKDAEYVVFVDAARRYVDFTEGVCGLLGYSRGELLDKTIEDVSYDVAEVPRLFAQFLKQGSMNGDYVLRPKAGPPVPIKFRSFVFSDGCHAAVWEPIRNWREAYLAALLEVDPAKMRERVAIALAAVQRQMQASEAGSSSNQAERRALRDALSSLQAPQRMP
jgi:hypothetical protein